VAKILRLVGNRSFGKNLAAVVWFAATNVWQKFVAVVWIAAKV
jgi:hypothetical protein